MGCCGCNKDRYYSHHCYDNSNSKCCDSCCDSKCCDSNYYYAPKCNNNDTCCYHNDCNNDCNNDCSDLTGISCPFHNNNDCACADSLRDAACRLTNQRVIIHVDGCKMCVVIVGIGNCFIKAVNPCTQKIVYFNINRIDNIEDVLPRCY